MGLAQAQAASVVTKAITMALNLVQSIIVVRILTEGEWGLAGLVMSIGAVIGVSQHLGVVDGAIREIAVLKNKDEIGKVFWVSNLVRQLVTIPLSLGLFAAASLIAIRAYDRPDIIFYIQLFALSLILQGLQDVLGATLTGIKRFGALYTIQVVMHIANIGIFGYLTWLYRVSGYFWAIIITTAMMVVLLFAVIVKELRSHLQLPNWTEVKRYTWRVMRVGGYMYLARIFFVVWQRLPLLVLGGILAAEELGFLAISLTFGSRLTIVAMALSEVNLSWMSSLFATRRDEFIAVVTRNMQRVLVLMMGIALILLFFTPEILQYVIGAKYLPAHDIILVMTLAFFLYALLDIGTSSVFVSADLPRTRTVIYGVMTLLTGMVVGWLFFVNPDPLLAAGGVLLGVIASYVGMVLAARKMLGVSLLTPQLLLFILGLSASVVWLMMDPGLLWRLVVFVVLTAYVLWEAKRSNLLPQFLYRTRTQGAEAATPRIICFAGAFYDAATWTNRQHVMSRLAQRYPVLYVEPRVWVVRYVIDHWKQPQDIFRLLKRILWWEDKNRESRIENCGLYVKAQWNLLPGSRENEFVSRFNHYVLNRWNVLLTARLLGFSSKSSKLKANSSVMWIYDTEAAQYLSDFEGATVVYDCVDDHAAQAGPDRNAERVRSEERAILARADLVTVVSQRLLAEKRRLARNVHLVLNAGDVTLYRTAMRRPANRQGSGADLLQGISRPIVGSIGALDSYKYNFDLLHTVAKSHPQWQFVFLGAPVVETHERYRQRIHAGEVTLAQLQSLPNVHVLGTVPREQAPYYVHQFDVCTIPYRENAYNASSFPLKFWEFMATGKPIVVSGLPELLPYQSLIGYANDPRAFAEEVRKSLASPQLGSEARIREAQQHTWEKRVERLVELLEHTLPRHRGYNV